MATVFTITDWIPEGFAECLNSLSGTIEAEAEKIANKASGQCIKGDGFHVEMTQQAKFQDAQHGVSRPVAVIVSNDTESAAEEAEYKILSKSL